MHRRSFSALMSLFLGGQLGAAAAQPARPTALRKTVMVYMPVGPGGALDFLMRNLTTVASTQLGQQVLLDYKPGGNGIVSTQILKTAPADGYSYVLTYPSFVMNPAVLSSLPYDTEKDFQPVAQLATLPLVIAVNAQLPIHNIAELVAYGKANPEKLSVGISGTGGLIEYGMEALKQKHIPNLLIVPYKGGGPAINAVLSGDISMTLESFPSLDAHAKSGKLRLIAVTSLTRQPFAPELPTVAETLPGFEISTWYGLLASASAPKDVTHAVAQAFDVALRDPVVSKRLVSAGWELVTGSGPAEFATFLKAETKRLEPLARQYAPKAR